MPGEEIERVVTSLTKAQREAVQSLWQDDARHAPYHLFPNRAKYRAAWREMTKLGFVAQEVGGFDLVIPRYRLFAMVCLTPLGLRVRQHLLEQSQERGEGE